jgi:hypothetical protein
VIGRRTGRLRDNQNHPGGETNGFERGTMSLFQNPVRYSNNLLNSKNEYIVDKYYTAGAKIYFEIGG